ncbi:hypothetical protein VMCG_09701 [Cytospora schulzeri]|uniref:Uncharacterized protein n=1 Tax=Cytospora schulzeri TaxID=448051 RepID=A0A423VKB0_9PEZI|nr:hypothetical protein VMCG_09701 [Valsa malicola]
MDPYSSEGELINIHAAFHQYQYQSVLDDFDPESFSQENHLPARVLQLRSRIALGQAQDVLDEVAGEDSKKQPELAAVAALADLSLGNEGAAVEAVEKLLAEAGDAAGENAIVQVLGGTVLAAGGKADEALALLGRHQGNLDAVALIVQIHLQQNRNDLALKEVASARRWAQDSILVNLAESWGGEKYQQAFYVFEELAQAPSTSSVQTLVAQAVAELHLGRTEEAQSALDQALKKDPSYAEAIANALVLQAIIGKDTSELKETLKNTAPQHAFLTDLEEKSALFDTAASKFSAKTPLWADKGMQGESSNANGFVCVTFDPILSADVPGDHKAASPAPKLTGFICGSKAGESIGFSPEERMYGVLEEFTSTFSREALEPEGGFTLAVMEE